ncbi:hypothetical protein CLOL250_02111 [Clostridium sp. L2-50]|nr:hypothetical protein CLOL250_02111 [Clostridium sp. L2-50]
MKAFHIFESFPPSFGATILVALFFLLSDEKHYLWR